MDMLEWVVVMCVFTAAFGRKIECPDGFYLEPRKGCKECSEICVNNPLRKAECSFYCDGWSSVPDAPKDPAPLPPIADGSESPDASPTNLQVIIIPIVCVFVLVSILGSVTYWYRTKWNPGRRVRQNANLPDFCPNNAIPLIEMDPRPTPEVIVHPGAATGGNDDNPDAKQAVIVHEGAAAPEGPGGSDGETSTGSRQSLYPFMEQPSQDANQDEPDYSSSTFVSGESNADLAQLIMNKMTNTDLPNLGRSKSQSDDLLSATNVKCASGPAMDSQPTGDAVDLPPQEFKDAGKYLGGARPKVTKSPTQARDSPKFSRVTLEKEPGGRRNKFYVSSQESPDQTLSDTIAVGQPVSEGDPTEKYHLGDQSSAHPYLTQAFNDLQQPAATGQLPNGVDTFHHDVVNEWYGGASRPPMRRPNDQRRPSQDEPPQL